MSAAQESDQKLARAATHRSDIDTIVERLGDAVDDAIARLIFSRQAW
jgi:hypothetical protein